MKKSILTLTAAFVAAAGISSAQTFVYHGIMNITPGDGLGLSADSSGALYYGGFTSGDVYKIADPVTTTDTSGSFPASEQDTVFASVSGFVASRGIQGTAVDSAGNVYAAGDNGGGTPQGLIRKFNSSGTEDATFTTNADAANVRAGGIALLGDDTLALNQFGGINYYATADFSTAGYSNSTGGSIYSREVHYNATDGIIYQTKNGNNEAVKIAGYYSGGSEAAGGYTWNASTLIGDGAINSAFGTATSHGSFDDGTDLFFDCANGLGTPAVRVYNVTAGGTSFSLAQTIDGTTLDGVGGGQPFPINNVIDAVYVDPYLYVSSSSNGGSIYVFENQTTAIKDWSMMD